MQHGSVFDVEPAACIDWLQTPVPCLERCNVRAMPGDVQRFTRRPVGAPLDDPEGDKRCADATGRVDFESKR